MFSHFLDDWHDYGRLVLFVMNIVWLFWLGKAYRALHKEWNTKTVDGWYSTTMWTCAGIVLMGQGMAWDLDLGFSLVFVAAATLVTGKFLHQEGDWGGRGHKKLHRAK